MTRYALLAVLALLPASAWAGTPVRSQDFASVTPLLVGNSTSPANAVFEVRQATVSTAGAYVLAVSSANAVVMFDVTASGHLASHGSAPTVSSCGATPNGSVVGNDTHGTITVGGGSVTACTLTFAIPRVNTPDCVISDNSTTVTGDISAISNTAFTASFSLSLGGGKIYYVCLGD